MTKERTKGSVYHIGNVAVTPEYLRDPIARGEFNAYLAIGSLADNGIAEGILTLPICGEFSFPISKEQATELSKRLYNAVLAHENPGSIEE